MRDLGGPSFALKRAIDEGLVVGPRIYPSGAMITITGGHGDFRSRHELPRRLGAPLTIAEELNASQLADSPDEVRMRTREQLLLGASQIKLTAGGGVASPHSPLDASTFTEDELRAAVQAAGKLGHLRRCARVHVRGGPARGGRRRQGHRARPPDGRGQRPA